MESDKTILRLKLLLRFAGHAAEVYQKALAGIRKPSFRILLESINLDHERHLGDLRRSIVLAGGDASEPGMPEPKVLSDAMHAMDTNISEETRLQVCRQWEEHLAEGYREALAERHSPQISAILERHLSYDLRHASSLNTVAGKR